MSVVQVGALKWRDLVCVVVCVAGCVAVSAACCSV